jgi:hypothetical protein
MLSVIKPSVIMLLCWVPFFSMSWNIFMVFLANKIKRKHPVGMTKQKLFCFKLRFNDFMLLRMRQGESAA